MPKHQPTSAKRARVAARAGAKFTTALHSSPEPPRLYPIVREACELGCDASPHPGQVCATWGPFHHTTNRPRSSWTTCQAADLPRGRASSLTNRFQTPRTGVDSSWVLALAYALLLDEEPRTAPDPQQLRAAVEADDLAAVDALMQPVDFAALHLLGGSTQDWHRHSRPRVHAWATRTTTAPPTETRWDVTLMQFTDRCVQLAERWLQSQVERLNHNGYMEAEYVPWLFSTPYLTELLLQQLGGHPRGSEVQLRDGRQVTVMGVRWSDVGRPPVAYEVREVGAPPFPLDNERVDAEQIR